MFCKYCGSEIPEGEGCTCEQAVSERLAHQNAQNVAVAAAPRPQRENVWLTALKALPKALLGVLGNFNGKDISIYTGVYFTAISIVSYLLFYVLSCVGIQAATKIPLKGMAGIILLGTLLTLVLAYGVSILLQVIGYALKKERVDIVSAFTHTASVAILPAVILLLAGIFALFAIKVAIFFALLALFVRFGDYMVLCRVRLGFAKGTPWPYLISAALCSLIFLLLGSLIISKLSEVIAAGLMSSLYTSFGGLT